MDMTVHYECIYSLKYIYLMIVLKFIIIIISNLVPGSLQDTSLQIK